MRRKHTNSTEKEQELKENCFYGNVTETCGARNQSGAAGLYQVERGSAVGTMSVTDQEETKMKTTHLTAEDKSQVCAVIFSA